MNYKVSIKQLLTKAFKIWFDISFDPYVPTESESDPDTTPDPDNSEAPVLLNITLVSLPKTEYLDDEAFDVTNGIIRVEYTDNISTQIDLKASYVSGWVEAFRNGVGTYTLTVTYEENGVLIYPDLIKVKVALDNGDILGIETSGYLNNHETRNVDKSNIISKEEAIRLANENLKVEETRLAIIPTEFKSEVFCWELKGTVEKRKFLLYVNAKTGRVEDILVIIQTESGTLTQ